MNRWENRAGYWKRLKYPGFNADVFIPYEIRKRAGKLYEDTHIVNQIQHSLGLTDVYCALYPYTLGEDKEPILTAWERGENTSYYEDVYPDIVMTLYGKECLYEHECGHHPILTDKQLKDVREDYKRKSFNVKVSRYMNFLHSHKEAFLLFDVQKWTGYKYDRLATDELFDQMLDYLKTQGYSDRIAIARHRDVCGDPDHTDREIHHDDIGDITNAVWFRADNPIEPVTLRQVLNV